MKTNSLLFVLSALLMISACVPKDKEIATPEQRLNPYNNPPNGGGGGPRPDGQAQIKQLGSFGLAAFLMEKQGEVLQLLSAARLEKNQIKGAYFIENTTPDLVSLVADNFVLKSDVSLFTQSSAWDFSFVPSADGTRSFDGLKAALQPSHKAIFEVIPNVVSADSKSVRLSEDDATLQVTKRSDDTYQVTYAVTSGDLVLGLGGVTETLKYALSMDLQVATHEFSEETLTIVGGKVSLTLLGRARPFIVSITNQGAVTFRNTSCPVVLGTAAIDKSKWIGTFSESGFSVKEGQIHTVNSPCGQRPVVDLNRILVY